MTTQTPAGWYPDPYGSPQLRWWDGGQWTDATHPLEQPAEEQGPEPPYPPGPTWTDHPANPTLRFGEPTHGQGQYGQPETTEPHYDVPGSATPQFSPPYNQPPQSGPQYGPPQPSSPPYDTPTQSGPQLGMPTQGIPQFEAPKFEPPPYSAPQTSAPQYGAPQYGAPQFGGPQWGGSQPPGYGSPPPKNSNPLPWIFGGLAALVVLGLIAVGAIFFVNRNTTTPQAEPTYPTPTEQAPSQEPPSTSPKQLPQPQDGRITDPIAGLSYTPPTGWEVPDITEVNGTDPQEQAWSSAVQKTAQAKYDSKSDWIGNVYTGVLNNVFPYESASDLQNITATVFIDFQRFYQIKHTQRIVQSKAIKIGDKDAWVLQFALDFSAESKAKGYKWNKENGAIVLMDRGEGQSPAILYVSVPDNLGTNVVEQVLSSLKPA